MFINQEEPITPEETPITPEVPEEEELEEVGV